MGNTKASDDRADAFRADIARINADIAAELAMGYARESQEAVVYVHENRDSRNPQMAAIMSILSDIQEEVAHGSVERPRVLANIAKIIAADVIAQVETEFIRGVE
jgi:hypothetical protein